MQPFFKSFLLLLNLRLVVTDVNFFDFNINTHNELFLVKSDNLPHVVVGDDFAGSKGLRAEKTGFLLLNSFKNTIIASRSRTARSETGLLEQPSAAFALEGRRGRGYLASRVSLGARGHLGDLVLEVVLEERLEDLVSVLLEGLRGDVHDVLALQVGRHTLHVAGVEVLVVICRAVFDVVAWLFAPVADVPWLHRCLRCIWVHVRRLRLFVRVFLDFVVFHVLFVRFLVLVCYALHV